MKLKKKLLKDCYLYAVVDKKALQISVYGIVNRLRHSGISIIQFRDKNSSEGDVLKEALRLSKLLSKSETLFIINDYLDIAKLSLADGLHIGQKDVSIKLARKVLGAHKIIGISCHSLDQAIEAQKKGADYIGIGPIFSTPTKPEYKAVGLDLIKKVRKKIHIPFFAIGGINQDNIDDVILAGANRVAICRAILDDKDISSRVKFFEKRFPSCPCV